MDDVETGQDNAKPNIASDNASNTKGHENIVTFAPGDPEDPRNWSSFRKWSIVIAITFVDLTVSWGASGFSPAEMKFAKDFGVSSEVATLGLSMYVLGLALGPMTLAPLSEYFGRTPLYLVPYGIFLLFLVGTALVDNLGGFIVLRILSGLFSSVTIANFGGTIADMWPRHQVGPAMSLFLWAAVVGSPIGYFLLSFVAQYRTWRYVFWALLGICGGAWLILAVVLVPFKNETRPSVLLRRRASRLAKRQGREDFDVPEEMRQKSVGQLFRVTLSRPFRFLFTEPVVMFAALYNGYLYGLSFLFNGAFNLVFGEMGYGFSIQGVGLTFLGLVVGISIGPITHLWQEAHYRKLVRRAAKERPKPAQIPVNSRHSSSDSTIADNTLQPTRTDIGTGKEPYPNIPESRLQLGQIAAVALPISLFWFAWTSVPTYHIHYIVPILATGLFGWSFYTLILMTYLYIEDSYMNFSASALAGVGLIRNLAGAGFPLFGTPMYKNEGYNWASSILAFLAILMIPIPFVLQKYGVKLRTRSPYASQHMDD